MENINFVGNIHNAEGGVLHLTVAGPNHFLFSMSYSAGFTQLLPLSSGTYLVAMSAATQGTFDFDINGNYHLDSGIVPDQFNQSTHSYQITIA